MGVEKIALIRKSYLLDTHTFLWACQDPKRLGSKEKRIIKSLDAVNSYVRYTQRGSLQCRR